MIVCVHACTCMYELIDFMYIDGLIYQSNDTHSTDSVYTLSSAQHWPQAPIFQPFVLLAFLWSC